MRHLASIGWILAVGGCADHAYNPNAPAVDPNAPRVHITSPTRGTIAGDVKTIMVTGTAVDDTAVASVTVNDIPATLADDGYSWTATVPVVPGTNLLHAVAKDNQGNAGKESRAVVAGPMAAIDLQVPNALTATLSAQTFAAIATGAAGYMTQGDLASLFASRNPVIDVGGGPGCLYGQGSITSLTVGGAAITLSPYTGGLWLDAELDSVQVGMHLQWAVACLNGSRDVTISAQHLSVAGNMALAVTSGNFDIQFDNPQVQITGFDVDLGGIPGQIVDWLHLDTAVGPLVGWGAEHYMVPALNNALAGLNNVHTVDVLGTMVDVAVKPAKIDISPEGAVVQLDTTLRAHGDDMAPGFVYVPNQLPVMDASHGFQLAVADDTANQLFGSLWAAKTLDQTFDLKTGSYGDVGKLFDSVELQAAVPPYVSATGGALSLTIGDLMATFRSGASVATEVAINAEVDLKVTTDPGGAMRLDVGKPTTYVDILDEGVEGANQLSNAQFETITSFALGRIVAVGSGALGAIPLPAVGGVAVKNLTISEQSGYAVVDGEIE